MWLLQKLKDHSANLNQLSVQRSVVKKDRLSGLATLAIEYDLNMTKVVARVGLPAIYCYNLLF